MSAIPLETALVASYSNAPCRDGSSCEYIRKYIDERMQIAIANGELHTKGATVSIDANRFSDPTRFVKRYCHEYSVSKSLYGFSYGEPRYVYTIRPPLMYRIGAWLGSWFD